MGLHIPMACFEFYIPAAAGLQLHFLIRTANDTWNCNSYHPGSVLGSVSSNNKREQNPYKNTDKSAAGKLIDTQGVAPCTLHGGRKEQCRTNLSWIDFLAGKLHSVFEENNFGNMGV
ncbi:unnamed protein product [Lepidochelys kempii]